MRDVLYISIIVVLVIIIIHQPNQVSDERKFEQRIDSLQRQLTRTAMERDSIDHSLTAIDRANRRLARVADSLKAEIGNIRGRYKGYRPSELSTLMEERAKK